MPQLSQRQMDPDEVMPQLPPIGSDVTDLVGGSLPPIGADVSHLITPTFSSANQKDASGAATVDPNTIGTALRHFWAGVNPIQLGQLLPWPKAAGGSGMDNPLLPTNIARAMHAVKLEGDAAWEKGDHVGATAKYMQSVVPILGPWMSDEGNKLQSHQYAAALGGSAALAVNVAAPAALSKLGAIKARIGPLAANPNPAEAAAVDFGQARGIPLEAGTATGNRFVRNIQGLADNSPLGGGIATRAQATQGQALTRVGGDLATDVHPVAVTPEQAGAGVRSSLEQTAATHDQTANVAYDTIRRLEQQPGNQVTMPGKAAPIDGVNDSARGQLRRIVHELDAAPYTPRLLRTTDVGGSLTPVAGTGGAGAKVFDDIVQRAGAGATRGVVQQQLEAYLAGGPETAITKAARDVAEARRQGRGGYSVSMPELPPSAMEVPTKLEATRPGGPEMGLPVDLTMVKQLLRPVHEQMLRQMPLTQQQANPGLKAITNILDGPDYAPLSQVDRDLSAIKKIARQHGGLARYAVTKFSKAVTIAAANGGPEVIAALKAGRTATIAKHATLDLLDTVLGNRAEPVGAYRQAIAPQDSGIAHLRDLQRLAPADVPKIGRAWMDDALTTATAEGGFEHAAKLDANWRKLGPRTKQMLFGSAVPDLDKFFLLAKKLAESPNPSRSALTWNSGSQLALTFTQPTIGVPVVLASATLAKMLRSPTVIRALTKSMQLSVPSVHAPMAAQAASLANLLRAARAAQVPIPTAADQSPP